MKHRPSYQRDADAMSGNASSHYRRVGAFPVVHGRFTNQDVENGRLMDAVKHGNTPVVQSLLREGKGDVNARDEEAKTDMKASKQVEAVYRSSSAAADPRVQLRFEHSPRFP